MSAFSFPFVPTTIFVPQLNSYVFPAQVQPDIAKISPKQEIIVLDDDEEPKDNGRELDVGKTQKQVRWRKQDDMRLFKCLEQYCRQNNETIAHILHKADDIDEYCFFWSQTAKKIKWTGTHKALSKRFKSLCNQSHLSCREVKLLRKLIRMRRKDSSITNNFILDHFPGFDIRILKQLALARKWIKKDDDLTPEDHHITYTIKRS